MAMEIGRGSYGEIKEIGDGGILIGNYCSIASEVVGITVGHNSKWVTTYPFTSRHMRGKYPEGKTIVGHPTRNKIIIGHDVWLGYGVTIVAPAYITSGCVVGAGSVVRGFVWPYSIVYGNPIMTYGKRFTEEQITELLKIQWWFWPEEKVKENLHLLCSDNIQRFIDAHSKVQEKRVCPTDGRACEALPPEDLH